MTYHIELKSSGLHTRDANPSDILGILNDLLDSSEELDIALGCPDQRSITLEVKD